MTGQDFNPNASRLIAYIRDLALQADSEEEVDEVIAILHDLATNGGDVGQVAAAWGLLTLTEAGPPSWKLRGLADAWATWFCSDALEVLAKWRRPAPPSSTMTPGPE